MSITYDEAPASRREIMREIAAIEAAKLDVRPHVGDIAIACDSAEGVYLAALGQLGHDPRDLRELTGHGEAAPRAIFQAVKGRGTSRPQVAMDAKTIAARAERFPNGNRLRHG